MLMLPARDPPLRSCRAKGFERAVWTCRCPVAPQHLAGFFVRIAIWQPLASWTAVNILFGQISEVLLAEAPLRFSAGRQRLRQCHCDACLVAGEDLGAAEVAAIGHGIKPLGLHNSLRLLGDIGKL